MPLTVGHPKVGRSVFASSAIKRGKNIAAYYGPMVHDISAQEPQLKMKYGDRTIEISISTFH